MQQNPHQLQANSRPQTNHGTFSKGRSPEASFHRDHDFSKNEDIKLGEDLEEQPDQHWFELRLIGKHPERRGYHSTFVHNHKMYIYGGHDIREGSLSSLWMVDLSKIQDLEKPDDQQRKDCMWHHIDTTGRENPGALSHHTAVVFGDKMYLFGGSKENGSENQNLFTLDLKSYKWEVIHQKGEPNPITRDEHSAILYDNSMIIFGGFSQGLRTNEIYKYHFKENKWELIQPQGNKDQLGNIIYPPKRASHSAALINHSMIIFGGKDEDNNKLNDVWEFNFESSQWQQLHYEGHGNPVPLPRSGQSASIYNNLMIIFGGIHEVTRELDDCFVFDLKNKQWIPLFEEMTNQEKQKLARQNSPRQMPPLRSNSIRKDQRFGGENSPHRGGGAASLMKQDFQISASPMHNRNNGTAKNSRRGSPIRNDTQELNGSPTNHNNASTFQQAKGSVKGSHRKTQSIQNSPANSSKKRRASHHSKTHHKEQPAIELVSPTSVSMKNSFIIKNADPSFDSYYKQMAKRKHNNLMNSQASQGAPQGEHASYGRVPNRRPPARDGHSGIIYGDQLLIFGGDRHHMPFNDFYSLDIKKEIDSKNFMFDF